MSDNRDDDVGKRSIENESSPITLSRDPAEMDSAQAGGSNPTSGLVNPNQIPSITGVNPGGSVDNSGMPGRYKRSVSSNFPGFAYDSRMFHGRPFYPEYYHSQAEGSGVTYGIDLGAPGHPNVNVQRGGYGHVHGSSGVNPISGGGVQGVDLGPSHNVAPDVNFTDPNRRSTIHPSRADFRINSQDSELDPGSFSNVKPVVFLQAMQRWDITFSGALGEDVELFISRVDKGVSLLAVRDDILLKALPFVFKGGALVWYRGQVRNYTTWSQVRAALRSRFADPDYQIALREEISRRTQADSEPIGDYLACMNGLFARTDPSWTEWECVRYAHRGMLPAFRVGTPLHERMTLRELESMAARQEQVWRSLKDRRPPPRPEESMCPVYAYAGPRSPARGPYPSMTPFPIPDNVRSIQPGIGYPMEMLEALQPRFDGRNSNNSPESQTPPSLPVRNQRISAFPAPARPYPVTNTGEAPTSSEKNCWNCGKFGHHHRYCSEPQKRICYRCRTPAVTIYTCPRCNQGNAQQ